MLYSSSSEGSGGMRLRQNHRSAHQWRLYANAASGVCSTAWKSLIFVTAQELVISQPFSDA
jgi:hypothetical protein